jgi:uncharacterized membrane protein (DUF2068 family)
MVQSCEIDEEHRRGLRSIAMVEIAKGILTLLVAIALAALLRRDLDLQDTAFSILDFFCVDPEHRWAALFLQAAGQATYLKPVTVLGLATTYSALRFVEGFGLWFARVWAEWLAIFSCAIYLPVEIHELLCHATTIKWLFLATNLLILVYLSYVREEKHRRRHAALHPGTR